MATSKGSVPCKTAKGSKRTVETSCVAWFDLLGYGSMLRKASFDPTHRSTVDAVERINKFQEVIEQSTCKYFLTLALNDGGAAHRDLSPRSRSVTYDFIRRAFKLHRKINEFEQESNFPGVRMVIAAGFRMRRKQTSKLQILDGVAKRLVSRIEAGEVSIVEAINRAVTLKPYYAAVPELAANFAFTKAYVAESSGSKGGFAGARVFLDAALLTSGRPKGLSLGEAINWKYPGLNSIFYPIEDIEASVAGRSKFSGFCHAFEVAENLASSEGIVSRLRKLRVSRGRT